MIDKALSSFETSGEGPQSSNYASLVLDHAVVLFLLRYYEQAAAMLDTRIAEVAEVKLATEYALLYGLCLHKTGSAGTGSQYLRGALRKDVEGGSHVLAKFLRLCVE